MSDRRTPAGPVSLAEAWRNRLADSPPTGAQVHAAAARLGELADAIRRTTEGRGGSLGSLPVRTRRAYQWLAVLADEDALRRHVAAQARLRRVSPLDRVLGRSPNGCLFVTGHLFSRRAGGRLIAHQAFMDAPSDVLDALVRAAARDRGAERVVRAYAAGGAFASALRSMDALLGSEFPAATGSLVAIEALYHELNARHFGGALGAPRIRWGARLTRRKLGHYDPASDVIELSRTLDLPDTPPLLVEFVLYHEMLHRRLGVVRTGRRVRAHTREFRRAERAFPDYDAAMELLLAGPPWTAERMSGR